MVTGEPPAPTQAAGAGRATDGPRENRTPAPLLTVVVPVRNEAANIAPLIAENLGIIVDPP